MTIEEKIDELYEFTLNNVDNQYKRLDIGVVDKDLASLIQNLTEIDVTNYVITIDSYSIIHTLERHGNPIKEAKRGQIGIEKHHFREVLDVILNPDNVRYETKHNKVSLIFEKDKGDKYYVVKEIRQVVKSRKTNRLVLQTFYIRKKRSE